MTRRAILIAGSPTQNSRSTALLGAFGRALAERDWELSTYSVESFPPEALLRGEFKLEAVARFLENIKGAAAIVFSTPVYKATYAGSLKVIIDLIDPTALAGKALLAIATARLEAHLGEVDGSFQRLYAFFQGSRGLPSVALLDGQVGTAEALTLDSTAKSAFEAALRALEAAAA
jgi:FMN reductase